MKILEYILQFVIVTIYLISIVAGIMMMVGCTEEENWGDKPFVDMEETSMYFSEHKELCERIPDSIFCKNFTPIGDIEPTREYALQILQEMNSNFKYESDDTWHYNDTVYEYLRGDCEDIASTMAKHMIDDGIAPQSLALVYRKISDTEAHLFLAVKTSDAGILHLDYANSGYQIEPNINFHMIMSDVGVNKWIKGNIE